MIRWLILGLMGPLTLALLAAADVPAAQPAAKAGEKGPLKIRELASMLDEVIDVKDFTTPMTLKEALGLLQDKLNAKYKEEGVLPILVDASAFKEDDPEAQDVYLTEVTFPPFPRKMSVATALRLALDKVPSRNAAYLLRQGMVEVTTVKAASPRRLLRQRVTANFKQYPLSDALDALTEMTGLNVVQDLRAKEKLKTLVTATFGNGITLEGALRLLTDMADLKLLITDEYVYVTSPANARVLREEAAEEARSERRPQAKATKKKE